jgi:hypothetical protein
MLTLLGFQAPEELPANLKADLDIPEAAAGALADNISKIVFAPIRAQLERELEAQGANAGAGSAGEINAEKMAANTVAQIPLTPVAPATPPAPRPTAQAVRAPISEAYKAGEPSTARKSVSDDPYREPAA